MGTTKVVDVEELNEVRSSRNWHSSVRASLRFCSLIRKGKKHIVVLAGSRRGMSGDCRPYSYLRSTWPVFLDALGAQIQRWPLPRFLECCPRSHIVFRRVFVSFDDAPARLALSSGRLSDTLQRRGHAFLSKIYLANHYNFVMVCAHPNSSSNLNLNPYA